MLKNLKARNYRGFRELSVEGLNRVNLFVGQNNSGKTSLLEAAQILASEGRAWAVVGSLTRRGEFLPAPDSDKDIEELDVSHLFHGHAIKIGTSFELEGFNQHKVQIACEVTDEAREVAAKLSRLFGEDTSDVGLRLKMNDSEIAFIPFSRFGGVRSESARFVEFAERSLRIRSLGPKSADGTETPKVQFIPAEGLGPRRLNQLWDDIVLTPDEPEVIESLRIIEPEMEKIAFLGREGKRAEPSIMVKLSSSDERVPLGSLGDGIKRLLSLSCSAIRAAGGCFLVDEIDTGLHHSVMEDMWRMVITTAQRLDVQVFATSHSQDCVNSLGRLHQMNPELAAKVTLHRLERGSPHSTPYGPDEIYTAALQDMEIR